MVLLAPFVLITQRDPSCDSVSLRLSLCFLAPLLGEH